MEETPQYKTAAPRGMREIAEAYHLPFYVEPGSVKWSGQRALSYMSDLERRLAQLRDVIRQAPETKENPRAQIEADAYEIAILHKRVDDAIVQIETVTEPMERRLS